MAKTSQERFDAKFDLQMLEMTIVAILTNVANNKFIGNCTKLFGNLDPTSYVDDYDKESRIFYIQKILKTIADRKATSRLELFAALNTDGKYSEAIDEMNSRLKNAYLSPSELNNIDKAIADQLRYGIVIKKAKTLSNILNDIDSENYNELNEEIVKLEGSVNDLQTSFRNVRESMEESKYDIDLSSDGTLAILQDIIDEERDPASKVKTGMQHVNMMLGGGFEKGRLYMGLGVAKGFKSGFLLNCAIYAKKYNRFRTKDPSKRPVIVYLTMENTSKETLKRINCYAFGNKFKTATYTAKSLHEMLVGANIFDSGKPKEPGEATLEIKYRKNSTVSTVEIKGILEDLAKDGKECVFLVVDYLMRMKPEKANRNGDLRLDLGTICNDLSDLAKDYDIPVLSASQMNREAIRAVETAESIDDKFAAAQRLNGAQTGESIDILRNVDFAFILSIIQSVSRNEEGQTEHVDRWLSFKSIASRFETADFNYVRIRFAAGNNLRLVEDINMERPASTLGDTPPTTESPRSMASRPNLVRRFG